MPRNFRVAIIGHTGRGNYGHGLDMVWTMVPNVTIVAVADQHQAGRDSAQKRLKCPNAYDDYNTMLQKERPHIVTVATRFLDEHRDMVVASAEAGASVYLEKPMARTLAEADAMIAACERHHVKLAISHQTRYSPQMARIQELIADGRIGDILEIRGRGKEDTRAGGQDMMVLGTHIFDMMRAIAGDARWCFARIGVVEKNVVRPATKADIVEGGEGMGPIVGNHINAMYGFDKGITGYFSTVKNNRAAGERDRFGITIHGTKGVIQIVSGQLPAAYLCVDPSWFPGRSRAPWVPITSAGLDKPETLKDGGLVQGNVWIVEDLMEAIEKDRQPKGNMYDGRGALEMILATYESMRQGRMVELPLKERRHPLSIL